MMFADHRRQLIFNVRRGETTTTYTYDEIGQLESESRTGYAASYTYDDNGNRASKTLNGGTALLYNYDEGDKLTSITRGGNTIRSFTYEKFGRMATSVENSVTTTYAYDHEARLTSVTKSGMTTNTFTYNGLDTRVGKVDSGGTKTFKRDGAYVTDPVLSDGAATYTPGISERRSSTTKYSLSNYLGSTTKIIEPDNDVSDTRQYDAFGNITSTSGSTPHPFGFAGHWGYQSDGDTGLQLLGHRCYDPTIGRFLSRDIIKDGRNWIGYARNNPNKYVDPTGLEDAGPAGGDIVNGLPWGTEWIVLAGREQDGKWFWEEILPGKRSDPKQDWDWLVIIDGKTGRLVGLWKVSNWMEAHILPGRRGRGWRILGEVDSWLADAWSGEVIHVPPGSKDPNYGKIIGSLPGNKRIGGGGIKR